MLGENGTEQFTVVTRVDGKVIKEQPIHDPFLHNRTTVGISRWDLFKAIFRKQYTVTVEVSVRGTDGVMRAIMSLDTEVLDRETNQMLEERRLSREGNAGKNIGYYATN